MIPMTPALPLVGHPLAGGGMSSPSFCRFSYFIKAIYIIILTVISTERSEWRNLFKKNLHYARHDRCKLIYY